MLTMLLEAKTNEAAATATAGAGGGLAFTVFYIVAICVFMYFVFIRPQKKQRKKQMDELRGAVRPGDNIMTTGGFYGVVLDVVDDTVIVEFGNNKNCRIPMHKNAIAEVEKEEDEQDEKESKDSKKK